MKSVDSTNKEIASFREALVGMQSDKLFVRVMESQKANPKGIKQWRARDDADWANIKPNKRARHS